MVKTSTISVDKKLLEHVLDVYDEMAMDTHGDMLEWVYDDENVKLYDKLKKQAGIE